MSQDHPTVALPPDKPALYKTVTAGPNYNSRPPFVHPHMRMQVLVQDRESLLFYKGPNEWTTEVAAAGDFKNVVEAIRFVVKHKLHAMDVIMHFDNPEHDLRLPLSY